MANTTPIKLDFINPKPFELAFIGDFDTSGNQVLLETQFVFNVQADNTTTETGTDVIHLPVPYKRPRRYKVRLSDNSIREFYLIALKTPIPLSELIQ